MSLNCSLISKVCYNRIMTIVITTSLGQNPRLIEEALLLSQKTGYPFIERRKQSVKSFLKDYDGVILIYNTKMVLVNQDGSELTFHPDTAMLRLKSSHDALLSLLGTESLEILDTTMGLASDSLVMASAGHKVKALESQPLIHLIVSHGLATYTSGNAALDAAMRSIQTDCCYSLDYLKKQPDQSLDIIYCDPMFTETITESENLSGLKPLANYGPITDEFVSEAKRVAKKKIIIKAHFRDSVFERFGFERQVRSNQKFHYGLINLEEEK